MAAGIAAALPPGCYSLAPFGGAGAVADARWQATASLSWGLSGYSFDRYKAPKDKKRPVLAVERCPDVDEALAVASAICYARDLINTPAQDLSTWVLSEGGVHAAVVGRLDAKAYARQQTGVLW